MLFGQRLTGTVNWYSEFSLFKDSVFVNLPTRKNLSVTPKSIRCLCGHSQIQRQNFESLVNLFAAKDEQGDFSFQVLTLYTSVFFSVNLVSCFLHLRAFCW